MKATKILAGLSAAAFAASMISMVAASADDIGAAGSKSITTTEETKFNAEEILTMKELLGGSNAVNPEDVVAVTFKSDDDKNFSIVYNGKAVTSHDTETGKDSYLNDKLSPNKTFRLEDINFSDFYVKLVYAPGIADDTIDINWEVLIESEVTDSQPESSSEVNNKVDVNKSVSYNTSFGFSSSMVPSDVTEYNQAVMTFSGLYIDPAAQWNSDCQFVIEITNADKLTQYVAVGGLAAGETIRYKGNDLKVIKTDDKGNITVPVPFAAGSTIEVKGLSWSDAPNAPYFQVDSIEFNNDGTVTPPTSSSEASSSSKPSSSSSKPSSSSSKFQNETSGASSSSSTASSSSSASSSTSSTASSSKAASGAAGGATSGAAGGANTSNPTTGAAALGALGVLLAGAAMVVSKKND